jgi:pyridoxamine 5'-phosphate oxidase
VKAADEAAPGGGAEELSEESLAADPIAQFRRWFGDAVQAQVPEPAAMVLATASAAGVPRARTVLLKGYDADGFSFYTNRTSRKGRDLADNPQACLVFPWHAMGRQVIIEGPVTALSQTESEPYFHSRPRGSQLGAWASRQSTLLGTRAELDARFARLAERWPPGVEVPMPDFWGGYLIVPDTVEFWQSRPSRLHDRLRYRRAEGDAAESDGAGWIIDRLSP